MQRVRVVLGLILVFASAPAEAQQYGPQPDQATRAEILALREAAWRAWFANDRDTFERIVPDELVALGWDGGPWDDRVQSLARMEEFARGGSRLTALEFPRNLFQAYGGVVVLYSSFRVRLTDRGGVTRETTGRGTEVFVRRNGRWVHTGWHLDTAGP